MAASLPSSIAALLGARAAAAGHRPFLTRIPETREEREELSYATFANWVGKTANLLGEEFAVGPGDRVVLALPTSWTTAVLAAACWTLRACVVPNLLAEDGGRLRVVVTGERAGAWPQRPRGTGHLVVGEGPAGRLLGPTPAGALPYGEEVLAHADDAEDTGPALDDDALLTAREGIAPLWLTQGDLLDAAGALADWGLAPNGRLLSTLRLDGGHGLALGLLGPLAARGALILAAEERDPEVLTGLARQERVAVLLTDAVGLSGLGHAGNLGGLTRILCPAGAPPEDVQRVTAAGAAVTLDLPGAPAWLSADRGVDGPPSRAG